MARAEVTVSRQKHPTAKERTMTWDHRIAKVAPYAATAIAMLLGLMVFAGYFQY